LIGTLPEANEEVAITEVLALALALFALAQLSDTTCCNILIKVVVGTC